MKLPDRLHATLAAAFALPLCLCLGCKPDPASAPTAEEVAAPLDGAVSHFKIYWPPRDPALTPEVSPRPLLVGELTLQDTPAESQFPEILLSMMLTRPADEESREFWNSRLAYSNLSWMDQVRVWDTNHQWLWPNLPYLLRLPGEERVERYGGVDPDKLVDNDFAAVLIRKYDASGVELPDSRSAPLVSAEWLAEGMAGRNLRTVVHSARSDAFHLHLGSETGQTQGLVKAWLIYADFLGAKPPRTWPKQPEWAGGVLAYFELDWLTDADGRLRGVLRHKRPDEGTGFDWEEWGERLAPARISDSL